MSKIIKNLGPALFIIGYVVGTGSVTSMVVSGAKFGLSLVWALFLSCFFTYFLLAAISKLTIVSGETLLYNFRKYIGSGFTVFIMFALLVSIVSSCVGVMGVMTEVVLGWIQEYSTISFLNNIVVSIFFIILLIGLFWMGKHKYFLNVMAIFVGIMALAFVLTSVMVLKETTASIVEFFPRIPESENSGLIISGMVGTTMAGVCLASRSILVQEQKWGISDMAAEKKDAVSSMIMTFVICFAIMVSATGTLYFTGTEVNNATDMMNTLGPWAGEFAMSLFTFGIIGAGLSSIFPNLLLFPWLISDYTHTARNMKRPLFKMIVVLVALTCLIVPIMGGKPVWILIASQAFSPFIMPLITLVLMILLNKKSVMAEYKVGLSLNLALGATFIFNCYMMVTSIKGFLVMFS
ncbi:Nramp family divalent metal transporter [Aestuariivivens sediminis]|uniref:Nramp family divalent metal transporter n=1 Tax=Aestuariivivens sediminis TaxID=2913557 RepID=UPI001F584521|nr:Nramp family divalent metal transporter [Aestuariivivens sediminis]